MTEITQKKSRQRGAALLMVIISLVVLTIMTADFMESNQTHMHTAIAHRDSVKADYLARSAVNMSRLLLSIQGLPAFKGKLDFPFWQYADLMLEPFSSNDGGAGLIGDMMGMSLEGAEGIGLNEGEEFSVVIVDEQSKLNINLLAAPDDDHRAQRVLASLRALVAPVVFDELFSGGDDRAEVDREMVVCEIKDFIDQNEDSCLGLGGEESYYVDVPYERKNAPFDSLLELHLVHGVGDDFWNTLVEPDPEDPQSRVMTVWGNGKLNVNTASTGALFTSVCQLATDDSGNNPCLDVIVSQKLIALIQLFVSFRDLFPVSKATEFINFINNPNANPMVALMLGGAPLQGIAIRVSKREMSRMYTTTSTVFSIYGEGVVGNATRRVHAVIDASPTTPDVLDPEQNIEAAGGNILYWRNE